jgi:putative phage-type endonuclease
MVTHTPDARAAWHAQRRQGIGASDAAAILGVHPYQSLIGLWGEKTGRIQPDDLSGNEAVRFGTLLEPIVLSELAERTGRQVTPWPQDQVVISEDHPWLRCTPDASQVDADRGQGLVEAKTANLFAGRDWSDEPPLHYQVQLQHQMAVTGDAWGTLCALIGGQRFVWFDCDRNQSFIDTLLEQEERFWWHVTHDTQPEAEGSVACTDALRRLYPDDNGEVIELPAEAAHWDGRLRAIKDAIKDLESEKRTLENQLKAAIGEATVGVLPDGSEYSYRTQSRKEHVVAASTFRVLRRKAR